MFEHDYQNYPELTNSEIDQMQFSSPHKQITEDFDAIVTKVHDGDTITLRVDFRDFDFPLRFSDIDAPELNTGDTASRDWVKARILGEKVKILINKQNRVDKYGRLLGRVFHNGLTLGEEMMSNGLAKPYGTIKEGGVPDINKAIPLWH